MGYFKKKYLVVLLLLLFIISFASFSNSVYGATVVESYDTEKLLLDNYEQSETTFIGWCDQYLQNNGGIDNTQDTTVGYISDIIYWVRSGNFLYFDKNQSGAVYCWLIPQTLSITSWDSGTWYSPNTNYNYTISGKTLNNVQIYYITTSGMNYGTFSGWFMAKPGYKKLDTITVNFVNKYLSDDYVPTQDVSVVGWNNLIVGINNLNNSIQENTEQQEETTNEVKKLNDFMSSEDVDEDAYDMPTDNPTQDITDSGFNGIFTKLYNKINNWSGDGIDGISYPIPFTNQRIFVRADMTENIVNNWGQLKNLLNLVWYVLVSLYVVKDVQKYIDGLKTGEILSKSDTNIKTEML